MHAVHTMRPVRARVLSVLRDGAATSVVAQMLHSNAVLKLAVGRWRKDVSEAAPSSATNARKPFTCFDANTLKPGQEVLVRVLAYAPPVVTVELAPAGAAEASEDSETSEAGEAPSAAPSEAPAPRKRQCLGLLP